MTTNADKFVVELLDITQLMLIYYLTCRLLQLD
jgi:hypothetical protein